MRIWAQIPGWRDGDQEPPSAAIDERHAKAASYFVGRKHGLIHRHREQITIAADHTARWDLSVDCELPGDPDARCGLHGGEALFLFPLALLKKAEGRTRFEVRDEADEQLPRPTRVTCDWVSARAAAEAADRIEGGSAPDPDLVYALQMVASLRPYDASVVLNELLDRLDPSTKDAWDAASLTQDLEMMIEHWMLWVPLRGLPGERRRLRLGQDVELLPRSFYKWRVGTPKRRRKERKPDLKTGENERYARIGPQIDFSVLGERLALPLGWLPIEFEFPTVQTRRCSSYHFELVCPNGLSPRGIKMANRESPDREPETLPDADAVMGTRAGIGHLPGRRSRGDVVIRATAGVGRGAFPFLWLLMGMATAIMLWYIVGTHPTELIERDSKSKNEIAAAILLVVPALLGAIAVGVEGLIARMIGGARLLLVASGLASVLAAAVLVGKKPAGFDAVTQWSICATVATVCAVPLTTSWLLSRPLVWRLLERLNTIWRQYAVFGGEVAAAMLIVALMLHAGDAKAVRAVLAICLLLMTVPLSLVAASRLPAAIPTNRYFISLGTIFAALTCAVVGCLELHAALVDENPPTIALEITTLFLLLLAIVSGLLLRGITTWFREKPGEVHLPPEEARALLEGKRVRELIRLRARIKETQGSGPGARGVQGNFSWGVSSTVHLPDRVPGEFDYMIERWPRYKEEGPRHDLEVEARDKLPSCLQKLSEKWG